MNLGPGLFLWNDLSSRKKPV